MSPRRPPYALQKVATVSATLRLEARALGGFASRARACSFAVLARDLERLRDRLGGLADVLDGIARGGAA